MDFDYYDEEQTPYKKKKKPKTVKKADHKHNYIECLVKWDNHISRGERCSVCGKLVMKIFFETEKTENGWHRVLTNDEVLKKFRGYDMYDYHTKEFIERV